MLCREILAVCCEMHAKSTNTLFEQNVEFVNVKPGLPIGFKGLISCAQLLIMAARTHTHSAVQIQQKSLIWLTSSLATSKQFAAVINIVQHLAVAERT